MLMVILIARKRGSQEGRRGSYGKEGLFADKMKWEIFEFSEEREKPNGEREEKDSGLKISRRTIGAICPDPSSSFHPFYYFSFYPTQFAGCAWDQNAL